MKIGYIYTVAASGYEVKFKVNVDGWKDKNSVVKDERKLWYKLNEDRECIAMSIVKDGVVLAISYLLRGNRPDDCVTTWVYIPTAIYHKINGDELERIVNKIREINRGGTSKVSEKSFKEDEILNKDYDETKYPFAVQVPDNRMQYAYRLYNDNFTLAELLEEPYQQEYYKYKYIFLRESGITGDLQNNDRIEDLNSISYLKKIICVTPLSEKTRKNVFGDESVEVFCNGKKFDTPISLEEGTKFSLTLKKADCEDKIIECTTPREDGEEPFFTRNGDLNKWWRIIDKKKSFSVIDAETGETIHNAWIKIDGAKDHNGGGSRCCIPEDCLSKVQVIVSADGYDEHTEKKVDLSKKGRHEICLTHKTDKLTIICTRGEGKNDTVSFEGDVYGAKQRLKGSERPPKPRKRWLKLFLNWSFVMGILFACSVYGLYTLYDYLDDGGRTQKSGDNSAPKGTPGDQAVGDSNKAVAYLNGNDVWEKDSLDKYESTNGLFEALNQYQEDSLNSFSKKLDCEKLRQVCDAIKGKNIPGKRCREGDTKINIPNYIKDIKERKPASTDSDTPPSPTKSTTQGNEKSSKDGKNLSPDTTKTKE